MTRLLGGAAFAAMLALLYLGLVVAPPEQVMGDAQRLLYVHVGVAVTAFFAFFVTVVGSVLFLLGREARWDRLAYASGELGVFFTALTLVTGSFWARAVWGVWWDWEPRLTTTAILFFIYVGYLMLRAAAAGDEGQARLAAVWSILGFAGVPFVYVSVRIWQGLHPVAAEIQDPRMTLAMAAGTGAFLLVYGWLLPYRLGLERVRAELRQLKEDLR